jgi:hypothetical protein
MQPMKDMGKIVKSYSEETDCPYCGRSKLRVDIEFEVLTIEKEQVVDSSFTIQNLCAHCLTVCNQSEDEHFLCSRCGQLSPFVEEKEICDSEWLQFQHLFSDAKDCTFGDFYKELIVEGLENGKRYCLVCLYKIWQEYLTNHDSLQEELAKPKKNYPLKTYF